MLCAAFGLGMMILLLSSSLWAMWKVIPVYNNARYLSVLNCRKVSLISFLIHFPIISHRKFRTVMSILLLSELGDHSLLVVQRVFFQIVGISLQGFSQYY